MWTKSVYNEITQNQATEMYMTILSENLQATEMYVTILSEMYVTMLSANLGTTTPSDDPEQH